MKKLANALASNPAWRFVPYTVSAPSISTVTPSSGAEGADTVIVGTGFSSTRKVLFGVTEATFWTIDSDTQITARVPAGTDTVDVVVQTAGGTATKSNGFTYSAGAAPVLSSSNYTQGDTAGGGQSIVLTGSGFTGVTGAGGVTFLGTNATSYTVDSDTQITAVLPAHAAGTGNIVVTHPTNGASNALAFEYWSPASLTLHHWQRANYATPTWSGSASGGDSGSRSFVTDTGAGFTVPTSGAGVGGYTQAVKDSTNDMVWDASTALSSLITSSAYTIVLLVKPTGTIPTDVDATNRYNEKAIVSEVGSGGAYLGVGCHDASGTIKVSAYHYDGTYTGPATPATKDAWNLVVSRYDGADLKLGVNGGVEATISKGSVSDSPGTSASRLSIGQQYTAFGSSLTYELLEYAVMPSAISDANITKYRAYANQRYGVSV